MTIRSKIIVLNCVTAAIQEIHATMDHGSNGNLSFQDSDFDDFTIN